MCFGELLFVKLDYLFVELATTLCVITVATMNVT